MSLDLEATRKVAKLARLDISEADLIRIQAQLSGILDYVDELAKLDTEGVEPMAHPLPLSNVFRADEPRPSLTPDEALANAPSRLADYFGVPAVFESDEPVSH